MSMKRQYHFDLEQITTGAAGPDQPESTGPATSEEAFSLLHDRVETYLKDEAGRFWEFRISKEPQK